MVNRNSKLFRVHVSVLPMYFTRISSPLAVKEIIYIAFDFARLMNNDKGPFLLILCRTQDDVGWYEKRIR